METIAPFKEAIDEIKASGGEAVKFCYQCGKCDTVCPWNRVRKFSMRKLIREATFGLSEIEKEDIWRCTTCGRCPQKCPRDVKQIDDMVALRKMATGYGVPRRRQAVPHGDFRPHSPREPLQRRPKNRGRLGGKVSR